ncbi:MAG TPA: oligosaccharide flippase family protein [Steroidobacteraceae bacterium]|nr:oligosaccharide flippase family protein [Steroidobacteraceae bacterium]
MTFKFPASLAVATGTHADAAGRAATRLAARVADDVSRLRGTLRRAGWALADQCMVSAANFLTIFLFARHLEAATFGAFMLAYTGLLLLTNLQNALIVQPHNVLAAGLAPPEYRRFTGALLVLQVLYGLAVCAGLFLVGWLIATAYSPATGDVLIALALTAVPWMAQDFARRVLYTRGESRAAAANDGVTNGLQLFGALMLIQLPAAWAAPASALSVLGLSAAAGALFGAWQLRNHVGFLGTGFGPYRHAWFEAWHFGKWLTAQNGLAWFGAQGHSWVVGLMLGVEQVGIYRAATHLVNLMNPLLQACLTYLPSRGSLAYHAGGAAGLSRWVGRTQRMLLLALAPFCVLLVVFPGQVLDLAYGGRFAGTTLALILALAAVAQCIGFSKYPFDIGLLALRSPKSIFYAYLIPVILLLTVGASLIWYLGILGVPLSGIVINSALLIATRRAYRARMRQEQDRPAVAKETS